MKLNNKQSMITFLIISLFGVMLSFTFSGVIKIYELSLAVIFLIVAITFGILMIKGKRQEVHLINS